MSAVQEKSELQSNYFNVFCGLSTLIKLRLVWLNKRPQCLRAHIFSENMPLEAPFVKVGKGASSGDAVDGSGEETGQGRAGNLVGKVLQQSLPKVPVKELEKTKPGKPVVKKVPKQKPRIDGPVFSQSPIQMKKVKLGGRRQKKTTNFMTKITKITKNNQKNQK